MLTWENIVDFESFQHERNSTSGFCVGILEHLAPSLRPAKKKLSGKHKGQCADGWVTSEVFNVSQCAINIREGKAKIHF